MSKSELSDLGPTDAVIEKELRDVIRNIHASGRPEELTVKRVRAAAEKSLSLDEGFLKQDAWKNRSKTFIEREAVALFLL